MGRSFSPADVLHVPRLTRVERSGATLWLHPERGNWVATDADGTALLSWADGSTSFAEAQARYSREKAMPAHEAHAHASTFYGHLERRGLLSRAAMAQTPPIGRDTLGAPSRLRELWLHTNNSCNLSCAHCLVGSGPDGERGMETAAWRRVLDEARELGVERYFFTGGEPLVRPDALELLGRAAERAEVVVLTNGLLFTGVRLAGLRGLDRARVALQISLDGATAATNDAVRGADTFGGICDGIRTAATEGFRVTVTVAVNRRNAAEVPAVARLAAELGARNLHLLWPHHRGRALGAGDWTIDAEGALAVLRETRTTAASVGISLDNWEALLARIGGPRDVRHDLSHAGWESLCVYADGGVYPSAALANEPDLRCGSVRERSLREIWQGSPVLAAMRALTVAKKPMCRECPVRWLCGGGDLEHGYNAAADGRGVERMWTLDPYCELHKQSIFDAMFEAAAVGRNGTPRRTGFRRPVPITGLGDGWKACATDAAEGIAFTRSACVLSVDLDAARAPVREFYGDAAEKPQKDLCCPTAYPREDTSHIPQEVLDVFYGCGSPVAIAGIAAGETVVDLGSGGGIDCFIAAKKVGREGRVFGIDMTDAMLERARASATQVAASLGFANVEFRKGYLEEIPLPDATAHAVLSNCVINLSPDKRRVFREMWRVLRDLGRIVVSDVVADRPIPAHLSADREFRGQCLGGSLTGEQFVAELESAGFYGLSLLEQTFWKEVHGIRFHSVTVRGFKFSKGPECRYVGQWAIYLGPFHAVTDDEGHLFPRHEAVEICTDTAAKLGAAPYAGQFAVFEGEAGGDIRCCGPDGRCC